MTIDEQLDAARSGLHRLGPREAADAYEQGALLIDIRPAHQRANGEIPGALVIVKNWFDEIKRLAPASR